MLDETALADGGYGGLIGVGQGSVHPPRLVRLGYTHPGATKTLVLVGKGITFDSGGLSLKPPKSMEAMKSDMGGAAAVLGAAAGHRRAQAEVNVVGYLTPGGEHARRRAPSGPSDVITIYGGKTVEVLNTDAEGRLVMADALARSGADSPDLLIDVATLTGAQLVALGPRIGGVMASDDAVRERGRRTRPAGRRAGLGHAAAGGAAQGPGLLGGRPGQRAPPSGTAGCWSPGLFLREFVPGRSSLGTHGHRRARLP